MLIFALFSTEYVHFRYFFCSVGGGGSWVSSHTSFPRTWPLVAAFFCASRSDCSVTPVEGASTSKSAGGKILLFPPPNSILLWPVESRHLLRTVSMGGAGGWEHTVLLPASPSYVTYHMTWDGIKEKLLLFCMGIMPRSRSEMKDHTDCGCTTQP